MKWKCWRGFSVERGESQTTGGLGRHRTSPAAGTLQAGAGARCPRKGRRAPELRARLEELFAELEGYRRSLAGEGQAGVEMHTAALRMEGLAALKFQWCKELPFELVRCTDRQVAQWAVEEYDRVHDGDPASLHRVSRRCLSPRRPLGAAMRRFAAGGEMEPQLLSEISAYGAAPLDEGRIEGAHRDVRQVSTRGRPSPAWTCATVRLRDTLDCYRGIDRHDDVSFFHTAMVRWKAVLQLSPTAARMLRPQKVLERTAVDRVYRLRESGLADWSGLAPAVRKLLPAEPSARLGAAMLVQADFLQSIFRRGAWISLLDRSSAVPGAEVIVRFWHVLEASVKGKKVPGRAPHSSMALPALLQEWEPVVLETWPTLEVVCMPRSEPVVLDLCMLAPFAAVARDAQEPRRLAPPNGVLRLNGGGILTPVSAVTLQGVCSPGSAYVPARPP